MSFPGALVARDIGLNLICRADGKQAACGRSLSRAGAPSTVAWRARCGKVVIPKSLAIGLGLA